VRRPLLAIYVGLAISAFALARSSPSVPPATRMQGRSTAPGGGYYALVIGNNNYASLPKLKTAEADAREVAALLKEFYGFDTRLLLNATRQQIVTALFSYRLALGPDANLLVYYAGHGINDTQAEKSYWLPVDATRDDDSNWISADDITTRIRAIPARHVLVISDSCYSGTLTRGLGEALPPPNAREQFLQRMMSGRSRTLMASGGDEPVADGGGGGRHSVFASALMRGLREIDRPRFTAAELFRFYVEEPVAGRAQQTPEYNPLRNSGHESGDFVFVRVKTIGKTAEAANKSPTPPPIVAAVDPAAIELSFWESIKASADPEDFKAYLDSYPSGRFATLARNNLRRLEAAAKAAPSPTTGNSPGGGASDRFGGEGTTRTVEVALGPNWIDSGVDVRRGQRVLVTASGTISARFGTRITPDGLQRTDPTAPLPRAREGVLIGAVGSDPDSPIIEFGSGLEFRADRDGRLYLTANRGSYNDARGSYTVRVQTERQSHPPAVGRPDSLGVGAAHTPRQTTITVPSTSSGTDTGIELRSGDRLIIAATGRVTVSPRLRNVGPEGGHRGVGSIVGTRPFPQAEGGALIGYIRLNSGQATQLFLVGANLSTTAPADGRLFLLVNDDNYSDNGGSFEVRITVN
jgi:hypothetical protein